MYFFLLNNNQKYNDPLQTPQQTNIIRKLRRIINNTSEKINKRKESVKIMY